MSQHAHDTSIRQYVEAVAERMTAGKHMVATAESCTGGGIGEALTSVAGSSLWYAGGVIAYSNALKQCLLRVPADTLEAHGAVSEPVAAAMAAGVAAVAEVPFAAATTGVAGPDGGSVEKPVGTVCFGFFVSDHVYTQTRVFAGDRQSVRHQAVLHALERLLDLS